MNNTLIFGPPKNILLVWPFEETRALQSTPFQNPGGDILSVADRARTNRQTDDRKSLCLILDTLDIQPNLQILTLSCFLAVFFIYKQYQQE